MPLLSLDEAKEALNITGTTYDGELVDYIDGATAAVENICGPAESVDTTEIIRAAGGSIVLSKAPVIAVTSVIAAMDPTDLVDTLQPVDEAGIVTAGLNEPVLRDGWYTVAYTYGRTTVPAAMKQAAKVILKHQWSTQRGASGRRAPLEDSVSAPLLGYALPAAAVQMLAPYALAPKVG